MPPPPIQVTGRPHRTVPLAPTPPPPAVAGRARGLRTPDLPPDRAAEGGREPPRGGASTAVAVERADPARAERAEEARWPERGRGAAAAVAAAAATTAAAAVAPPSAGDGRGQGEVARAAAQSTGLLSSVCVGGGCFGFVRQSAPSRGGARGSWPPVCFPQLATTRSPPRHAVCLVHAPLGRVAAWRAGGRGGGGLASCGLGIEIAACLLLFAHAPSSPPPPPPPRTHPT